ncbi:translation initiation factor IF-2-like [Lynx canadensis]|uniref:translation initiation factor IF-2-like n=1 Tax=Lynx canadensis TaxID=61383 RepID=UPI0011B08581|nr:translation initiation factor IF-2-like [Lynx canadensis]
MRDRRSWGRQHRAASPAPQLSAGTARPAPAAPPPPERLPAAAATAAAEAGPGCTPGAGTHGTGRSFLRARVRQPASPAPRRPFFSPPGPGLRGEGAGGGRRRRAEEEKESKKRSVPGEKPAPAAAASPLPPSRPVNAEMAAAAAKRSAGSPAPLGAPTTSATSRRKLPRRGGCWVNTRPQPWSRAGGWPRPFSTRRDGAGPQVPNHSAPPNGPAPHPPP